MKFRPLHDRVVIERIDAEAKTAGGIIIPRSSPLDPVAATRAASSFPST